MAKIVASAEGTVDAPADTVYGYIADMREHHPRFLPPAFSDFQVESGGVGAGTCFKLTAGGRTREYRTVVAEPEPGRILTESDTNSSAITTFTVSPQDAASAGADLNELGWLRRDQRTFRADLRAQGAARHLCR